MATTHSTPYPLAAVQSPSSTRDLLELTIGFSAILAVLWLPTHEQLIFGPIALLAPLVQVLLRKPRLNDLGLGLRGLVPSLWILPATVMVMLGGIFIADNIGTYHAMYNADLAHVDGYVLWTMYQQFLLQDYFMPRLSRVLSSDAAIGVASLLFALAHLPNLSLALACLIWGAVSSLLFRRYRNLYMLGLAQGMLGLCFAVCVPDAWVHHMRVGLGYWRYHQG